jgi:hypothetical protein
MIAISAAASAAPNGQSRAERNCCWIRFPTMTLRPPPSSSGTMKFPMLGTNTKIEPATTPGSVSGSNTRRNDCHGVAYRSDAASRAAVPSRSSEE